MNFVSLEKEGGEVQSDLVFSKDFDLASAVKNGYALGSSKNSGDVAVLFRQKIVNAFAMAVEMPWPPTATYLENAGNQIPESLCNFLRVLISGKDVHVSNKTERLVSSIGQDIYRVVTAGQWKQPKHILVCMTLRHLFRSTQLNIMMNKLGHAESYSFALELETALAVALEEASGLLTLQIARNPTGPFLFHSDSDNFDQFINDLSGSGSVHTSHGIMMQNIQQEEGPVEPLIPTVAKTGACSLAPADSESLPPCFVNQRSSPQLSIGSDLSMSNSFVKNLTWCIIRLLGGMERQCVPGWAGFISETGQEPENLTKIDYYPVVHHSITENNTVQECLRMSKQRLMKLDRNTA